MNTMDNDFKRLEGHPEPKELPVHEAEAAAPVAATPVTEPEAPVATADIDAVRGGGFGWAALGGLAAALIVGVVAMLSGVWHNPSTPVASPDVIAVYDAGTMEVVGDYDPLPGDEVTTPATVAAVPASGTDALAVVDTPDAVYLFDLDGSQIIENEALNAVAKVACDSDADVTVNAYTDESGSADYNLRLSERRAKAVSAYLVAHGVPADHITIHGNGPTHAYPTVEQDRRAEVYIN